MTNVDQWTHATLARRYQVQTRSGAAWESVSVHDLQSEAFASARSHKRSGYRTRVVDTRTDKIVPVPR